MCAGTTDFVPNSEPSEKVTNAEVSVHFPTRHGFSDGCSGLFGLDFALFSEPVYPICRTDQQSPGTRRVIPILKMRWEHTCICFFVHGHCGGKKCLVNI